MEIRSKLQMRRKAENTPVITIQTNIRPCMKSFMIFFAGSYDDANDFFTLYSCSNLVSLNCKVNVKIPTS